MSLLCVKDAAVSPGGKPGQAAETVGEMALVGKAGLYCGFRGGGTVLKKRRGLFNADGLQIAVGRDPRSIW